MRMVTVVSVPRSGTRFLIYFFKYVAKVPVNYVHFLERDREEIEKVLASDNLLVMPLRDDKTTKDSLLCYGSGFPHDDQPFLMKEEFMPRLKRRGTYFVDIEKRNWHQIDAIIQELGMPWTQEMVEYIDAWEPVGSKHNPKCKKSAEILKHKKALQLRGPEEVSYP